MTAKVTSKAGRATLWTGAALIVLTALAVALLATPPTPGRRDSARPSEEKLAQADAPKTARESNLLVAASDRPPAPNFQLKTTSGDTFELQSAKGRVVVLSFLAVGCESCQEEVDALESVESKLAPEGAEVLLLDLTGMTNQEIIDYYKVELGGGDHLYAQDPDLAVSNAYRVVSLGTTVVIDRRGRIAFRDEGLTPPTELSAVVGEALEEA